MPKLLLKLLVTIFSIQLVYAQTITVSNQQLNFGVVYENAPDSLQLTLTNNLSKNVTITAFKFYNIYGHQAFSCSQPSFTLAIGTSQMVWIKFTPLQNIYHNSELVIENDAQRGFVNVDLVGQGRYSKTYYNASENLEEQALKNSLQNITGNGYNSLGYNGARDNMFMLLDNQKTNGQGASQNTLECIYTGRLAIGYASRTDCQNNDQFNTEHTFPQGFFNSNDPMKSDLHHLFPTDNVANNTRNNYPFGVATTTSWSVGGSIYDNIAQVFEPRDQQKGATARAMLYFVIRYQNYNSFLNSQEAILKTWNQNFLPTSIEQVRNNSIYSLQNNRNPFVDYPRLADRISSFSTTSIAPVNFSIDQTQNEIDYGLILSGTNYIYKYLLINNGNQIIQFINFNLSNTTLLSFVTGSGSNTTLNPGETLAINIDLHPALMGPVNESLTFQTNIPGLPNVLIPIVALSSAVSVQALNPQANIQLYPNPASDKIMVSQLQNCKLTVTTILGTALSIPIQQNENETILDITSLSKGMYFINADEKTIHWHKAFIKK